MTGAVSLFFTCEHGGNRIPEAYRASFAGNGKLLRTHRGYDIGALRYARELAAHFGAPLMATTVSRLLVDLNRSPGHPGQFSEFSRTLPHPLRMEILERHYQPFRSAAELHVGREVAAGRRVVHVSCHSFTPVFDGELRNADVGFLYDPGRDGESALCSHWRAALRAQAPGLRARMNYPYRGTADGFTVHLRRRFAPADYVGIELEVNQAQVRPGAEGWLALRQLLCNSLESALAAWDGPSV
ncbi:N-formylglutamate amidohydrolase [Noviherbaspirillum galbum]|uniref:N-formylglutamate amidohydrolase n=1 Tax=Noviherbaspirillum galbum TaxID=2709383 RepID=A0A6B3SHN1_9BURK|nr:N-formylglutamate amidohydrolase [Noviherbaspirillum galbum]NEX60354.1 N-formylglutamate amidohydrolase [Noviherbaspirillum galbum]